MSRKSPSQLKILNDTLDLMTLMTHRSVVIDSAKVNKKWWKTKIMVPFIAFILFFVSLQKI